MTLPKSIHIRELGPREGFQTLSQIVPTPRKLELIDLLSQSGIKELELTSFVRADRVPQMADAEEIVTKFKKNPDIKYTALYLNEKGFIRAEECKRLSNDGWIYIAASETFLRKNNNTTISDVINNTPNWVNLFKNYKKDHIAVMISTAFGCNYEGRIEHSKVIDILSSIVSKITQEGLKVAEISLADTMGHGVPESVKSLVSKCQQRFSSSLISLHLHDTRGTGLANVYAGLEAGVTTFDSSVGGMGGCPFAKGAAGNVCTEDIVYMCEEMGIHTGIKLDTIKQAAILAESIVGERLPGKYYKS